MIVTGETLEQLIPLLCDRNNSEEYVKAVVSCIQYNDDDAQKLVDIIKSDETLNDSDIMFFAYLFKEGKMDDFFESIGAE